MYLRLFLFSDTDLWDELIEEFLHKAYKCISYLFIDSPRYTFFQCLGTIVSISFVEYLELPPICSDGNNKQVQIRQEELRGEERRGEVGN